MAANFRNFHSAVCYTQHTVDFTKFLYHDFLKKIRENNFFIKEFTIHVLGWLRLYSDMSKVENVNLPGREIDKHDEISG